MNEKKSGQTENFRKKTTWLGGEGGMTRGLQGCLAGEGGSNAENTFLAGRIWGERGRSRGTATLGGSIFECKNSMKKMRYRRKKVL